MSSYALEEAVDKLELLVSEGMEYPEAEYLVFIAFKISTDELRAEYDRRDGERNPGY